MTDRTKFYNEVDPNRKKEELIKILAEPPTMVDVKPNTKKDCSEEKLAKMLIKTIKKRMIKQMIKKLKEELEYDSDGSNETCGCGCGGLCSDSDSEEEYDDNEINKVYSDDES